MAVAVFLLLCGILAAELAVLGLAPAGVVGAVLFAGCAAVLAAKARSGHPPLAS